jgi:hypothetical protein
MNRLWMAMGAYVVLAILAWMNLTAPIPHSEFQVRHVVLAILLALAASTCIHRKDRDRSVAEKGDDIQGGSDS